MRKLATFVIVQCPQCCLLMTEEEDNTFYCSNCGCKICYHITKDPDFEFCGQGHA